MRQLNYMKTPSTLMVVGGALNCGTVLLTLVNTAATGDAWAGQLVAASVLVLLAGGAQLAAGIVGLRSRGAREKMAPCLALGIAVAVLALAAGIFTLATNPAAEGYLVLATLLLPALYLNAAWQTRKPPPAPLGTPYAGELPRFGRSELDRQGRPMLRLMGAVRFFLVFFGGILLGLGLFATFYTLFVFGSAKVMGDPVDYILIPAVLDALGLPLLLALRWRWTLDPAADALVHRGLFTTRATPMADLREGAGRAAPAMWAKMRGIRFFKPQGSVVVMFYYSKGGDDFIKVLAQLAEAPLPPAFYSIPPGKIGRLQ